MFFFNFIIMRNYYNSGSLNLTTVYREPYLSAACTSSDVIPGSLAECPESATMLKSASGHFCNKCIKFFKVFF